MIKKTAIASLPHDVALQLDSRLLESGFGDFVGHSEWLRSVGYEISKSAIHRYAQSNQVRILQRAAGPELSSDADVRVRCLEVAARLGDSADYSSLTRNAEDLLRWVYAH